MSTSEYKLHPSGREVLRSVIENDGVVSATERYLPSALPMTALTFSHMDHRIYLLSRYTRQGILDKGALYFLDAVTQKGLVIVRRATDGTLVNNLFPMDYFVEMVAAAVEASPLPFDPEPQDAKKAGKRAPV